MAVLKLSQIAAAADNLGSGDFLVGVKGGTTDALFSIAGATVTASDPIFDMSQTWNNGAVVFTGFKFNVTVNAAQPSYIFRWQAGGSDILTLTDGGILQSAGGISAGGYLTSNSATLNLGGAQITANAGGMWANFTPFNLANSTTAQDLRVYNTTDSNSSPTNYERGVFDWTTSANVLTIGTQAGGTGTLRETKIIGNPVTINGDAASYVDIASGGSGGAGIDCRFAGDTLNFGASTAGIFWNSSGTVTVNNDLGLFRAAAGVLEINSGVRTVLTGSFLNWGGQARVTSDFTVTSSTALVNVTGLLVNVAAGRTYNFQTELYVTDAAAGGVQAAIAGTATATAIQYTGYTIADNAIKAKTNATALATAVGSTVTTETSGIIVRITGTITVNAAGTLTVQMAQNTSNGTATTAKRGSYLIVQDMP